ncbi:MAG: beta-glucosidase [Eubacteriales bacterium]|nr:beta-glucosidase [Eubacteriales bacterium]
MGFADDFAWGAATASYQNEGGAYEEGKGLSIWDVFTHQPGRVEDGTNGDVASDQFHHIDEDINMMHQLSMNAYRFSLCWPRIIPGGTGQVNRKGLDFYDHMVDTLLQKDITPYITLFHWDLPYDLFLRGGWLNPDMPKWFADYTTVVMERLSDRVNHWITQNEPQCFIGSGLEGGLHAPGLKMNKRDVLQAAHIALLSHGYGVQAIKAGAKLKPVIGYAPASWWLWSPVTDSPADIEACRKQTFNAKEEQAGSSAWWMDPVFLGHYPQDAAEAMRDYMPSIGSDDMKIISQPIDFLGMNVYQSYLGKADEQGECVTVKRTDGYDRTAYPWPVTPQALYWGPKFLSERYHTQIIVTENGISNVDWVHLDGKVHDPQRIDFTARYLRELRRAAQDGVDIAGYFHWTLTDNFEWATGFANRFGLIYVDFPTQKRIIKDSGFWYRDVIRSNGANL